MCKKCWIVVSLLLLLIAGAGYQFMIAGDNASSPDGRIAIPLSPAEKDLVLTEMRSFLNALQQISSGISEADFKLISEQARLLGSAAQQGVPISLMGKLPLSFKKLGFDTHQKFDLLAMDAEQLQDKEHTLKQMSTLMSNCVSCHAAYKIETIVTK
ncbi:MAG: hypothetical protein OEY11_14345 [Gammaproteobacteria bacterium]|nr:hypothetical protein [Gammaproteobacteria bacterium]